MMLEVTKQYAGFILNSITSLPDVNATAYQFEHLVSGAKLLYLQSKDDNKVFTIGFRTPSKDNTGIAHIMEHSVLCGSRKYRLKEPFVELVKGSLNTFLNAMTYSDKTIYPVASRNAKDFHNLMDVYLDAVFYPLIYENPYTLKQEGWHYEIANENDKLTYNGVVYNEMKGVYSSADAAEENAVYKALFPNSVYRFDSGGLPEAIPNLTQDAFTAFHKTYYVPENAYIYLYGDLDIEATLNYLDSQYLCHFPRKGKLCINIALQSEFAKTKEVVDTYSIAPGESTEHKTYLSLNIVTATALEQETIAALKMLNSILLEGNNAPLRLALVKAGLGSDVSGSLIASQLQPVFSIKVSGAEAGDLDKFVSVVYKTLQGISRQGLDKELVESYLNVTEFKLREADFGQYPKGLIYGLSCLETWLYGGDPLAGLKVSELLASLRAKIDKHYLEGIIEKYLLDNTHKVLLTLKPEPGKEERYQKAEEKHLAELKAAMSDDELKLHIAESAELHRRQEAEDDAKALASIPILNRSDIKRELELEDEEQKQNGQQTIIYNKCFTEGIIYTNWYFDMTGITPELLPYAYLLSDILGKVDTKDFTYQELPTYANKYTGGITFAVEPNSHCYDANKYNIQFVATGKVLEHNLSKLLSIFTNIALTSDFTNKKRIKEIVDEVKADWDDNFFNRGLTVALTRLNAYFSTSARVAEQDQLSYYEFINKLVDDYDTQYPSLVQKLQGLLKNFFHQDKQLFAYSCNPKLRTMVERLADEFINKLPHSSFAGKEPVLLVSPGHNEGIMTSGKVQYVVAGGNFQAHGHAYTGAMKVLETILRYGYLWTKIRVQGGAYGANALFGTNGLACFSSYRDPNLEQTLAAYNDLPEFLHNFTASEREMTKYVIGTMSLVDMPLTNAMHLEKSGRLFLKHSSTLKRQKMRDEMLQTTQESIRALEPIVRDVLADKYFCVVGSSAKIINSKNLFDQLKRI